jgi:carbon-monoxide dehydrogenase large subunit
MPGIADDAFAGCDVVVRARINNQRVAPCPLEVRGSAAVWHDGRLIQWISSQHAQGAKTRIATTLGVEPDVVRIITPDVGGGFGARPAASRWLHSVTGVPRSKTSPSVEPETARCSPTR